MGDKVDGAALSSAPSASADKVKTLCDECERLLSSLVSHRTVCHSQLIREEHQAGSEPLPSEPCKKLGDRSEELLIKEIESVRSEIAYKMKQEHWVTLGLLAAPLTILPAITAIAPPAAPDRPILQLMLFLMAVGLCLLLLWVDLYCLTQNNGIRRASAWIHRQEVYFGLAGHGWDTYIQEKKSQFWDGYILQALRDVLVGLYYLAAALFAVAALLPLAEQNRWKPLLAALVIYGALAVVYVIFLVTQDRLRFKEG